MGGEESRVEMRERGGKEKNSTETKRRRQGRGALRMSALGKFLDVQQKKNLFVCGKRFYCFLVASAAGAPGYVSDIKRILFAWSPIWV